MYIQRHISILSSRRKSYENSLLSIIIKQQVNFTDILTFQKQIFDMFVQDT